MNTLSVLQPVTPNRNPIRVRPLLPPFLPGRVVIVKVTTPRIFGKEGESGGGCLRDSISPTHIPRLLTQQSCTQEQSNVIGKIEVRVCQYNHECRKSRNRRRKFSTLQPRHARGTAELTVFLRTAINPLDSLRSVEGRRPPI